MVCSVSKLKEEKRTFVKFKKEKFLLKKMK